MYKTARKAVCKVNYYLIHDRKSDQHMFQYLLLEKRRLNYCRATAMVLISFPYLQEVKNDFGLPPDVRLLDEFYCSKNGVFGKMYIFSTHVCFVDMFSGDNRDITPAAVRVTWHDSACQCSALEAAD